MEEAKVKFGLGQINNPTPQWAKTVFRIALYASAATTIILGIIGDDIPAELKVKIMKYAIEGTTAIHALSKLFGIDISDINAAKN